MDRRKVNDRAPTVLPVSSIHRLGKAFDFGCVSWQLDGTCSTYGEKERFIKGSGEET